MACLGTLKGINSSCEGNIGGIQKLYIADFDGVTVTPDYPNCAVSAITGTSKFYTYVLEKRLAPLLLLLLRAQVAFTTTRTKLTSNSQRWIQISLLNLWLSQRDRLLL